MALVLIVLAILFFGAVALFGVVAIISGFYLEGAAMVAFGILAPLLLGHETRSKWLQSVVRALGF